MSPSDNGSNPTLRLQGVGKWFGSLHVLDEIDIDVKTQEILTILGPSGCGKTTLLRIVNGLILCERGEVSFTANYMKRLGKIKGKAPSYEDIVDTSVTKAALAKAGKI